MPKMARNRSALHNVLAQGASNRDITVSYQLIAGDPVTSTNMVPRTGLNLAYPTSGK